MKNNSLVKRSWNGTPISRRTSDGYVNATAMCRANGKRWAKYRESDRANEYLEALSTEARISVHALIESRSGGAGGGTTWIHPRVAVDLARWISAPAEFMPASISPGRAQRMLPDSNPDQGSLF